MASIKRKVFSIGNGILKIALEDVWNLKLHERTIPEFITNLKASISKEKVLKDPVMVDEKTLVVLDGMHRVVALRELGLSHIPCSFVDYMLPSIRLGAWYRVIAGETTVDEVLEMVRSSFDNLKIIETPSNSIIKDVNDGRGIAAFWTANSSLLIKAREELDCKEAYDLIYLLEEKLRSSNLEISYQTEFDAKSIVSRDKSAICLVVPALSKKDVLRFAIKGDVFAPKATRHVFPVRILGLNVPLDLLQSNKLTLDEANDKLHASLSSQKLTRLSGGQIVEGRRYEEPIYLFQT